MRPILKALAVSLTLFSVSGNVSANDHAAPDHDHPQGTPITYNFGQQYQIQSKILSEDRQVMVYLPEAYKETAEKLPVIYILEGNTHFQHAVTSIEKIQKSGWMPASVIVGIPDNDGTNVRDYRHERARFLRFLNEEVQPFITKNFRVNDYKTLFGHSDAGTLALEAFIKNPKEFDNYIVANPFIRQDFLDRFEAFLDTKPALDQALYFTVGSVLDNGTYNVDPVAGLAEILKEKAPEKLQWHYKYLPLHGFRSSANVTLYDGLSITFHDYQGPFIRSYQEFVDGDGMEGVKAYYKERAAKYHISDAVEIGTFMGLGFMFMDSGYPKESVDLIQDAIKNYFPESVQLHRVLSRAYQKLEDKDRAIAAYEKMVTLAKAQNHPRLDSFENLLARLKQEQ